MAIDFTRSSSLLVLKQWRRNNREVKTRTTSGCLQQHQLNSGVDFKSLPCRNTETYNGCDIKSSPSSISFTLAFFQWLQSHLRAKDFAYHSNFIMLTLRIIV